MVKMEDPAIKRDEKQVREVYCTIVGVKDNHLEMGVGIMYEDETFETKRMSVEEIGRIVKEDLGNDKSRLHHLMPGAISRERKDSELLEKLYRKITTEV